MRWLLSSRAFRRIVASRDQAFSGRKEFVYKEKALGSNVWNAFTTSASGRVSLYRSTNSGFFVRNEETVGQVAYRHGSMSFQSRNIRTEALLWRFPRRSGFPTDLVVESILCQREPFGFRLYKQVVGKSAGYQHGGLSLHRENAGIPACAMRHCPACFLRSG